MRQEQTEPRPSSKAHLSEHLQTWFIFGSVPEPDFCWLLGSLHKIFSLSCFTIARLWTQVMMPLDNYRPNSCEKTLPIYVYLHLLPHRCRGELNSPTDSASINASFPYSHCWNCTL